MAGDFRVLPLLILALSSRGFLEMSTNPIAHGEDFRCGGLAVTKAASIKNILRALKEKRGEICLEYLRSLSVDEIKAELSKFKGIGPKTALNHGHREVDSIQCTALC